MLASLSVVALEVPSAGSVLSCLIEKSANGKTKFRETFNCPLVGTHMGGGEEGGKKKSSNLATAAVSLLYYQTQKLLLS